MKTTTTLSTLSLVCIPLFQASADETFLLKDGQPYAEIIIAEDPPRTTHLAARELQTYVENITGATLGIGTELTGQPIGIYVGESPHTEKLGITAEGLKYGAYRIVSGEDWLVLIGQDSDFTPIEPWPRSNADSSAARCRQPGTRSPARNGVIPIASSTNILRSKLPVRHTE
jgi:hypothetical protein